MDRIVRCLVLASVALVGNSVHATTHGFYEGKSARIIVGFSPGGTYDLWARLVAQHMGKHIPGNPALVVQNMPGAGP